MQQIAEGWNLDVQRGPDWLFVRVQLDQGAPNEVDFASAVWNLLQTSMLQRVVIELDELPTLHSKLIGDLVRLHQRVQSTGGLVRLSGMSDRNQQVLELASLDRRFPQYSTRQDAVMGSTLSQPHFRLAGERAARP